MKENAYLRKVKSEVNKQILQSKKIYIQMCLDAAMIAANEVFNMGPTRCTEFANAFSDALNTIAKTTVDDAKSDKSLWYTKDKLDERLKKICGEHFVPWDQRYA